MGSSQSNPADTLKIDSTWQLIQRTSQGAIYKDNQGQMADQNFVIINTASKKYKEELEIYNYRKNQNNPIVKVYGVEVYEPGTANFCSSEERSRVLTERIHRRLAELPQISFLETIYMLLESLKGYKQIYRQIGSCDINDKMIGVTPQGFVRVWVNQNFALNKPIENRTKNTNIYNLSYKNTSDQATFVKSIMDIIQKHCQTANYPQDFKRYLSQTLQNIDSSFQGVQAVIYNYAIMRNLRVPDRLSMKCALSNNFQSIHFNSNNRNYQNVLQSERTSIEPNKITYISPPIISKTVQSGTQSERTNAIYQDLPTRRIQNLPVRFSVNNMPSTVSINQPSTITFQQPSQRTTIIRQSSPSRNVIYTKRYQSPQPVFIRQTNYIKPVSPVFNRSKFMNFVPSITGQPLRQNPLSVQNPILNPIVTVNTNSNNLAKNIVEQIEKVEKVEEKKINNNLINDGSKTAANIFVSPFLNMQKQQKQHINFETLPKPSVLAAYDKQFKQLEDKHVDEQKIQYLPFDSSTKVPTQEKKSTPDQAYNNDSVQNKIAQQFSFIKKESDPLLVKSNQPYSQKFTKEYPTYHFEVTPLKYANYTSPHYSEFN